MPLYMNHVPNNNLTSISDFLLSFSTIHALIMAVEHSNMDDLRQALLHHNDDISQFLEPADKLDLMSFSIGTWLAELTALGEDAIDNLIMLVMIVTPEGRARIKRRQEIKAIVNEAKAAKQRAEAEAAAAKSR